MHVQGGRLLVQPHEGERRLQVLDQVDPLLVMLDRLLALALVRERGADLAVQLGDVLHLFALLMVRETPLPHLDRRIDAAQPERNVASLLGDPRAGRGIVAGVLRCALILAKCLAVRIQGDRGIARGLRARERLEA